MFLGIQDQFSYVVTDVKMLIRFLTKIEIFTEMRDITTILVHCKYTWVATLAGLTRRARKAEKDTPFKVLAWTAGISLLFCHNFNMYIFFVFSDS